MSHAHVLAPPKGRSLSIVKPKTRSVLSPPGVFDLLEEILKKRETLAGEDIVRLCSVPYYLRTALDRFLKHASSEGHKIGVGSSLAGAFMCGLETFSGSPSVYRFTKVMGAFQTTPDLSGASQVKIDRILGLSSTWEFDDHHQSTVKQWPFRCSSVVGKVLDEKKTSFRLSKTTLACACIMRALARQPGVHLDHSLWMESDYKSFEKSFDDRARELERLLSAFKKAKRA